MNFDLKLKSIEFKNFRLFEEFEMDFHPNLTVLIGENGSGKTALVEGIANLIYPALKLIENPFITTVEEFPIEKKIWQGKDILFGKKFMKKKINLEYAYEEENGVNESSLLYWEVMIGMPLFNQNGLQSIRRIANRIKTIKGAEINVSLPIAVYYPCEKVDNEINNGESTELLEDIYYAYENSLNARAFDFPKFFEWFKWQEDREARGQGSKVLNEVRKAILEMLNDDNEVEKFKRVFIDVSRFKNYQLMLQKDEAELEVSQLSSGEKSLLALVSDIARRLAIANPNSEDPLREGDGIVLIDEIDLHLHPRWQRKIIKKLCEIFPKIQFIITTHSPLIISSIKSENIRLLEDGKVYSIPETLGQNVGVIIKQIMGVEESIYDKELKNIFRLLAKNNIEEAKKEIENIESDLPADIPELREAKAILKRKEILSE